MSRREQIRMSDEEAAAFLAQERTLDLRHQARVLAAPDAALVCPASAGAGEPGPRLWS